MELPITIAEVTESRSKISDLKLLNIKFEAEIFFGMMGPTHFFVHRTFSLEERHRWILDNLIAIVGEPSDDYKNWLGAKMLGDITTHYLEGVPRVRLQSFRPLPTQEYMTMPPAPEPEKKP